MKSKKSVKYMPLLLLIFTLVGCSTSEGSEEISPTEENSVSQEGQSPEVQEDEIGLYGEIKEVIGNEVEIKVTEIPERLQQGSEVRGRSEGASATGNRRQKNYTGEEESIIIPVGVPIVVMSRGENGMTENEISLNELTVGSDLSVFYENDGETIKKIKVQKERAGTGGESDGK